MTTLDTTLDTRQAAATALSLDAQWMPFTANRAFKGAPRLLTSAKDCGA